MHKVLKMLTVLAAGIAVGMLGLFLVYMVPVQRMQMNVKESLDDFMSEGENPFLADGYKGSSLDNFTDAIMLGNAVYENDLSFWQSAAKVPRAADVEGMPMESLEQYLITGESSRQSEYARYWHGYLLLLKPLLLIFNYGQIRIINGCVQLGLVLCILYLFMRRGLKWGMAAYILSILSLFPIALPYSLQFSSVFYIGNIALFLVLKNHEKWQQEGKYIYFFQMVGMCTSYFDFLTYPLYTFGLPLVACLALKRESGIKDRLRFIIPNGISWGAGYGIMWMGKWLTGSLITGENLWESALGTVSERASSTAGGVSGRFLAILRNFYIYFNRSGIILALLVALLLGIGVWKCKIKLSDNSVWIMILIACMPLVWYLAAANHSYIHYWYTFRALAVSVFALAMIPECMERKTTEMERAGKGI